jgi:hypothetical protein
MIIHVDAAFTKHRSGVGVVILKNKKIYQRAEGTVPSSLSRSSIEAEACAVLFGLDLAISEARIRPPKKTQSLIIHTDCLSLIEGVYDSEKRPRTAEAVIRTAVKELNKSVEKGIFSGWRIEPLKSGENLAHDPAVEARFAWTSRIRQR